MVVLRGPSPVSLSSDSIRPIYDPQDRAVPVSSISDFLQGGNSEDSSERGACTRSSLAFGYLQTVSPASQESQVMVKLKVKGYSGVGSHKIRRDALMSSLAAIFEQDRSNHEYLHL